jgi:hypothetical protein
VHYGPAATEWKLESESLMQVQKQQPESDRSRGAGPSLNI